MTDNTTNIIASIYNIENGNTVVDPDFENDVIVIDSKNTRLGIGTPNPLYPLDVIGNAKINNLTLHNSNLTFGNNSYNDDGSSYSLAFGNNNTHNYDSNYSFAFGGNTYNNSSSNSLAFGDKTGNIDDSKYSFAFGDNTYNNSSSSCLAFGYSANNSISSNSIAFGNNTYNSNSQYSLAFGNSAQNLKSKYSFAFGNECKNNNTTDTSFCFSFGNNITNKSNYSFMFGNGLMNSQNDYCFIIGKYNKNYADKNLAFVVGYGIETKPENILELDNDGNLFLTGAVNSVGDSSFNGNVSIEGDLTVNGTSIIHFTGTHGNNNNLDKSINNIHNGLIVSTNNSYINIDFSIYPTIDESLPYCNLTTKENDKSVFGVVNSKNPNKLRINSLGEGALWVCNINGNLENGDYITSSNIPGYGQKQTLNEGILCNFTVAKITAKCEFNLTKNVKKKVKTLSGSNGEDILEYDENNQIQYINDLDENGNQQLVYKYNTRFIDLEGNILKDSEGNNLELTQEELDLRISNGEQIYVACFIGCTYHCG